MSDEPTGGADEVPVEPPPIDESAVERLRDSIGPRHGALLEQLKQASGTAPTLLAVSKNQPVEAVVAAIDLGQVDFGENYAAELGAKAAAVAAARPDAAVRWHFIGQLQRNKVRRVASVVDVWQSIDRARLVAEVAKRAPGASMMVQVNLADDDGKAGCTFDGAAALVDEARSAGLSVVGLMGVGTAGDDTATRTGFARLRALVDRLGLVECSMGMTADLHLALEERSTMVRIGTAYFGPRPG